MSEHLNFDETLRLLAQVEPPSGLTERVKTRLKTASATAEVIAWPEKPSAASTWLRRAAAAAIVFVVGGGSWVVYSGVNFSTGAQNGQKPVVIENQQPGEFGNAGAMRKVDPLTAPFVAPTNKDEKKLDTKKTLDTKNKK